MTQLAKFIALYKECGIDVKVEDTHASHFTIVLEAKTHDKISGYTGFQTWLVFDKDGNFIYQSIWE